MKKMKDKNLIQEWKKENGNANYTQKEMLMYLVAKVDKISDKVIGNTTSIKYIKAGFTIVGIALVFLFGKIW